MIQHLRVLLDSNILLSYLLPSTASGSSIARVVNAALQGEYTLLVPDDLLTEVHHILRSKPYFAERISQSEADAFVATIRASGRTLSPLEGRFPEVVRDPRDNFLIAAALLGAAEYLVTGDHDLLDLAAHVVPFTIIQPADFVRDVLGHT